MAFATGTVNSLDALYTALNTFMVGNGWSHIDSPEIGDKVYFSSGTDGTQNFIVRITASNSAGNPYLPTSMHRYSPHILVRGYQSWNTVTHVGDNEFGEVGPWYLSSSMEYYTEWKFRLMSPQPTAGQVKKALYKNLDKNYQPIAFEGFNSSLSEARITFLGIYNGNGMYIRDLVSGGYGNKTYNFTPMVSYNMVGVIHVQEDNGDLVVYCFSGAKASSTYFSKYNITKQKLMGLAKPEGTGWTSWLDANGYNVVHLAYDGADSIYALQRGTKNFAKYSISTDTWTKLADCAVNVDPAYGTNNDLMVFMPASTTGMSSDVIFALVNETSDIYQYSVATDAWTSYIGKKPFGGTWYIDRQALFTDKKTSKLYVNDTNNYNDAFFAAPISGSGLGDFTLVAYTNDSVVPNYGAEGKTYYNPLACKLKGSDSYQTRYWFVGNADGIIAVTLIDDNYFWMKFGKYVPNTNPYRMIVTENVSAGLNITVSVDSSEKYSAGDSVFIFKGGHGENPAAHIKKAYILEILSPTTIVIDSDVDLVAGDVIALNPHQFILTGDSGFAVSLLDLNGIRTDNVSATYYVHPSSFSTEEMTKLVSARNTSFVSLPLKIFNSYPEYKGTYENKGFIYDVMAVKNAPKPAPQPGDIARIDDKQYLTIESAYTKMLDTHRYVLLIGPIN